MAPGVIISLLGQVLINVVFQVLAYYFLYQQRFEGWYVVLRTHDLAFVSHAPLSGISR